jgi:hypothetical protein
MSIAGRLKKTEAVKLESLVKSDRRGRKFFVAIILKRKELSKKYLVTVPVPVHFFFVSV